MTGGGVGGIRNRGRPGLPAPARGSVPLAPSLRSGHPMKGAHPLQNPQFEPHPYQGGQFHAGNSHSFDVLIAIGGGGGIRTHGPLQDSGFQDRPIRPL